MAKYMLVYKGPATDMSEFSEEQVAGIMQAWKDWMNRTGSALLDIGHPMANGYSLMDDGSSGTAAQLNGYSIIEAEDMASAKKIAEGHPFLSEGKGNFAIDIFELMPVPM